MTTEDVCKQIRERQRAAQYTFFRPRHIAPMQELYMLSPNELEAIRAEVEDPSGSQMYTSDALEVILTLLWHIDAVEAQGKPKQLPEGARTLPDGSIRLGPPRRYQANKKAAQNAYYTVVETRRRKLMQAAIQKRKGA